MRFCDKEVIEHKKLGPSEIMDMYMSAVSDMHILFFVIEAIKSGAENIKVVLRDAESIACDNLTLLCDSTINKDSISVIANGCSPAGVVIDDKQTNTNYYYTFDIDISDSFNRTKVTEKQTTGIPHTILNTSYFLGEKNLVSARYSNPFIRSSFLIKTINFITAYLELMEGKIPNISLDIYPNKQRCLLIPIEPLGLLNTARHNHYSFDNYTADCFFLPKRVNMADLRNMTFFVRKKGDAMFQVKQDECPPLLINNIFERIIDNVWRISETDCTVVVLQKND